MQRRKFFANIGAICMFAFIGTSGPHLGVVPAPWHRARTARFQINGSLAHAPRTPNFNQHAPDHHPLLATQPALDARALEVIDMHFRDRLRTLLLRPSRAPALPSSGRTRTATRIVCRWLMATASSECERDRDGFSLSGWVSISSVTRIICGPGIGPSSVLP